jgi:hypothetical protein
LIEIRSDPAGITLGDHGGDVWIAGDGEHIGVMGAGGDTVTLGDEDVQVLLDHGVILRDPINGNLILASDLSAIGSGDDVLQAGVGSGFVIGGGGNDEIKTGRSNAGGIGAGDGRHIILGDGGQIDFDPSLGDTMGLVKVQALRPDITGNDLLAGGGGDDIVIGGPGSDDVSGEQGRDFIAGDFLLIDFIDGIERDVITPFQYYFEGAGDTLRSGLDGDFVFGGTQFNRFSTAASVDVIFETYGRILFVPSTSIYTISRVFNLGISGSFLDERVADGQLATRERDGLFGTAGLVVYRGLLDAMTPERVESLLSEAEFGPDYFGSVSYKDFISSLFGEPLDGATGAVGIDGFQQQTYATILGGELLDLLSETSQSTTHATKPEATKQNAAEPRRSRPEPNKELITASPRDRITSVGTPQSNNGIGQAGIEQNDDFFSLLETGGVALAAVSAGSYRQYGKARSVGSLEQRLRHWTGEGFALKGDDQ